MVKISTPPQIRWFFAAIRTAKAQDPVFNDRLRVRIGLPVDSSLRDVVTTGKDLPLAIVEMQYASTMAQVQAEAAAAAEAAANKTPIA